MKQVCQNCHFLAKETREEQSGHTYTLSLTRNERQDLSLITTHYSLKCWMKVWDEGVAPHPTNRADTISAASRTNKCFFWPYQPNMQFDAGKELQARAEEHRQMKRSNLYTRIGLWIAAIGLFFDAIVRLIFK